MTLLAVLTVGWGCGTEDVSPDQTLPPSFASLQPDLFGTSGARPNAWADYDGDGDLDLFVGFVGHANRLYRNDRGVFADVAAEVGLADSEETRAAAWGDYDSDGDLDLYVGFGDVGATNRLYRNDGTGVDRAFVDVAAEVGVERPGETRQPAFIDYDGDGDLDLFVAFRYQANALFRNEGGMFTDVTEESGVGDPRRTVGAAWFDMDGDGDLDVLVANQNGDEDGFYRNLGDGTFEDVAGVLGMNRPGRPEDLGSVGLAVADYDNDEDLDVFVASYGPDVLWENQGDGTFLDVAPGTVLAGDHHSVAAAWGDYDNDGWLDLYVGTYFDADPQAPDHLFKNVDGTFENVTPELFLQAGASHGVTWADFDHDGDLDLSVANYHEPGGSHPLYRNTLDDTRAGRSLQVAVVDTQGRWSRAGATITLRAESVGYVSSRIMDSGGGYDTQGVTPVHFGLPPGATSVSVTVSWFEGGEKRTSTVSGVDPRQFRAQWLVLQLGLR
jgi:hypothetical protein